ncbi:kinase-like domain-containing protein [Chiua virens]|nr:kinase-like domain-containing protein [Chiua virens]
MAIAYTHKCSHIYSPKDFPDPLRSKRQGRVRKYHGPSYVATKPSILGLPEAESECVDRDGMEISVALPRGTRGVHELKLVWLRVREEQRFIGTGAQPFFYLLCSPVRDANQRSLGFERTQIYEPSPWDERVSHIIHVFIRWWYTYWNMCAMASPLLFIAQSEHPSECVSGRNARFWDPDVCSATMIMIMAMATNATTAHCTSKRHFQELMMTFDDYDENVEIISNGPTSIATRIESELSDGPRFIAIKTSTMAHAKEPLDIIKEVRLLASLSHPNIIPLIKQEPNQRFQNLSFWMPYMPYSLDGLLKHSRFSPTPHEVQFVVLAKSIIFQVLPGASYLHSEHVGITHRDIKPSNILMTPSGCARLIDFGIAFCADAENTAKANDLWPESIARIYFEVSTGPYRPPELLFGPRSYVTFAIDVWSLGVTLVEFFASLRLQTDSDSDDEDPAPLNRADDGESGSESSADSPRASTPSPTPFIIPRGNRPHPGIPTGRWTRMSLFDATRGEIGLAWSIFRVVAHRTRVLWPVRPSPYVIHFNALTTSFTRPDKQSFLTLPDASKVSFANVDAVDLSSRLPNLPLSTSSIRLDTTTHVPVPDPVCSLLDLVHCFLVYEPARRFRPSEALRHHWFKAD